MSRYEESEINKSKGNHYWIDNESFTAEIFLHDEEVKVIKKDIETLKRDEIPEKLGIVLADSPWRCMQNNPHRGPNIDYKTETLEQITEHLDKFSHSNVFGIFVMNYTFEFVLGWIENDDYELVTIMDVIKINKNSNLH